MTATTPPPGLAAMIARPNWVGFKREARPGETKLTKIPYQVAQDERGRDVKAKAGDRTTWDTWPALQDALATARFDGPGFEFHEDEDLFFVDLDHVVDPVTRKIQPLARAIMALLNTFAEPSISGTGIHIYGQGKLPRPAIPADRHGKKQGPFELYGGKRFATMTFKPFLGYDTIREVNAETMGRLCLLMWPQDAARQTPPDATPREPVAPITLDDAALLDKAFAAKGGDELYRRHQGTYVLDDKSDDDFAYLGGLRFWTQADPHRMRRIALTSGRVRDKWHTRRGGGDWLDYSIENCLKEPHEVYNPTRSATTPPSGNGTDADAARLLAERDALITTLRADVARLGDQLRVRDAELAEVREERDFYRHCLDCPDPVVGRAMPVIAEELHRAYRAGSPIVQDGQEFARLNFEEAAAGKAINRGAIRTAADRLGPATPLLPIDAKYHRNGRDMPTKHYYVACPIEERVSVARLGLGLLRRAAPQQRHQGRKPPKIMPTAVAAQDAPVRREQVHVEKFFSLRDDTPQATPLATQTTILNADYWTPEGEQLTQEAARDWQVAHGVRAATVETQQYPGAAIRRFVGAAPPAATTVEFQQKGTNVNSVETQQYDFPLDPPGMCQDPDCARRAAIGGYCEGHYGEYSQRYAAVYDYVAGAD